MQQKAIVARFGRQKRRPWLRRNSDHVPGPAPNGIYPRSGPSAVGSVSGKDRFAPRRFNWGRSADSSQVGTPTASLRSRWISGRTYKSAILIIWSGIYSGIQPVHRCYRSIRRSSDKPAVRADSVIAIKLARAIQATRKHRWRISVCLASIRRSRYHAVASGCPRARPDHRSPPAPARGRDDRA